MDRLETLKAKTEAQQPALDRRHQPESSVTAENAPIRKLTAESTVFSPRSPVPQPPMQNSPAKKLSAKSPEFLPRSPAQTTPRSQIYISRPSASLPPTKPRVYRWRREPLRYHGRHATEGQGYWHSYPDVASSADEEGSGVRADPITDASTPQSHAQTHQNDHAHGAQRKHDQFIVSLHAHLAHLQQQATCIATAYRNFGLLFHSFPFYVFWHRAIHQDVRGFVRANFLVGDNYPLPEIIQVIGTLSHALRAATAKPRQSGLSNVEVRRVQAELTLAKTLIAEAASKLELLRQALEIFCRLRAILLMEKGNEFEGAEKYRRRVKLYQAWAHALPAICWEGFRDVELERLNVAKGVAMDR